MAVAQRSLTPVFPISLHVCAKASKPQTSKSVPPPLFISTNPGHVNLLHLRDLFRASNLSCHRFPTVDPEGRVEAVDIRKLHIAIAHSSVVVSVFCKPEFISGNGPKKEPSLGKSQLGLAELFGRGMPVTQSDGNLVGFGRAVSDNGLTASIYDVMVLPSLRRMGIGRMIVKRVIRLLTNRGIYDIAALCSQEERLFFQECGFGDDVLGSTAMMYTRTASSNSGGNQMVKHVGRKLLLIPESREHLSG